MKFVLVLEKTQPTGNIMNMHGIVIEDPCIFCLKFSENEKIFLGIAFLLNLGDCGLR